MAPHPEKHRHIYRFVVGGWARWLPLLSMDVLLGVVEVALAGGEVARCMTMNAIWFRDDVQILISAFDIEEFGIQLTGEPDRIRRLRELRERVAMVVEFVATPYPRDVGDVMALMLALKIIERRQEEGRTLWRPAEKMPSILDFDLPPTIREKEVEIRKEYPAYIP